MRKYELPIRKGMRWDKQDYSHPGEYALTICVKDKQKILSEIIPGDSQTVGDGVPDVPHITHIKLTHYGEIADKYINQLNDFYKHTCVEKYVIMPNHIHLLVRILYDDEIGSSDISGTSRTPSPTDKQTDITNDGGTPDRTPSPTDKQTDITNDGGAPDRTLSPTGKQTPDSVHNGTTAANSQISKFVSAFKRFCHRETGTRIFQRSYYDHVIRDENDRIGAINYINSNPDQWLVREEI